MDEFDSNLISRDLFKRFNGCRIYLRNSRYNGEKLFPCVIGGYRLVNNSLKVRQYDGVYCICFNSRHLLNQTYFSTEYLYFDRRLHSIINDDISIATIHFITRSFCYYPYYLWIDYYQVCDMYHQLCEGKQDIIIDL